MNKFCILILAIIQTGMSSYENCIDNAIRQIISKPKISQITIFLNDSSDVNISQQNMVFQRIMSQIPIVSINLAKVIDGRFLGSTVLKYPRTSSVYIILQSKDEHSFYFEKLVNILNLFVQMSPVMPRPKCLMILFSESDSCEGKDVRKILLKAWDFKFLDFSILNINNKNNPIICTFNPFIKSFSSSPCTSNTFIFPGKLQNMNNYNITLPIFNYLPMMSVHQNSKTNETEIMGFDFGYLKIFSKRLNFALNYVNYTKEPSDPNFFKLMFNKLANNDISILGVQLLVGANLYNKNIIIGKMYLQNRFIILAPVLPISKINYSMDVLIYLLLFPSIVVCFSIAANVMKFSGLHWKVHNILRVLLGGAIMTTPLQLAQRITFFILLFLSMKYSTDAFTQLTNVELIHGDMSFDKAEDVIKSGFSVYAPEFMSQQSFNDPSEVITKLRFRIKSLHQEKCMELLKKWKNCVCISPYRSGIYNVDQSTKHYGRGIVKISKPSFLHDYLAFAYESGSPFVEKFNELMQMMIEAGIPKSAVTLGVHLPYQNTEKKKSMLLLQLLGILGTGYLVSCIAFVIEVKTNLLNSNKLYAQKLKFICRTVTHKCMHCERVDGV